VVDPNGLGSLNFGRLEKSSAKRVNQVVRESVGAPGDSDEGGLEITIEYCSEERQELGQCAA